MKAQEAKEKEMEKEKKTQKETEKVDTVAKRAVNKARDGGAAKGYRSCKEQKLRADIFSMRDEHGQMPCVWHYTDA